MSSSAAESKRKKNTTRGGDSSPAVDVGSVVLTEAAPSVQQGAAAHGEGSCQGVGRASRASGARTTTETVEDTPHPQQQQQDPLPPPPQTQTQKRRSRPKRRQKQLHREFEDEETQEQHPAADCDTETSDNMHGRIASRILPGQAPTLALVAALPSTPSHRAVQSPPAVAPAPAPGLKSSRRHIQVAAAVQPMANASSPSRKEKKPRVVNGQLRSENSKPSESGPKPAGGDDAADDPSAPLPSVTESDLPLPDGPHVRFGGLSRIFDKIVPPEFEKVVSRSIGVSGDREDMWRLLQSLEPKTFVIGTFAKHQRAIAVPALHFEQLRAIVCKDLAAANAPPDLIETIRALDFGAAVRSLPNAPLENVIAVTIDSKAAYKRYLKALTKHYKAARRIEKDERELAAALLTLEQARWMVQSGSVASRDIGNRINSVAEDTEAGFLFLCLDVEAFERDHKTILEIGWTLYDNSVQPTVLVARHFVVQENLSKRNGRFVPDHRFRFGFGVTETLPLARIVDRLRDDLDGRVTSGGWSSGAVPSVTATLRPPSRGGATRKSGAAAAATATATTPRQLRKVVLVGHGIDGDIAWLRTCGIQLRVAGEELGSSSERRKKRGNSEADGGRRQPVDGPETEPADDAPSASNNQRGKNAHLRREPTPPPAPGRTTLHDIENVFDTAEMDCAVNMRPPRQRVSLSALCQAYGIDVGAPFHNAGNDAFYTMEAFLGMTLRQ